MPEGDTVWLAARRLDRALAGDTITASDFRVPRYATVDLAGQEVLGVGARGKHLLMRFSGGQTLHSHFKMDGEWHVYQPRRRWRLPAFEARVVLSTEAAVAVGFRLAVLELMPTEGEGKALGHLGPDLLGDDWNEAEAARRLNQRAASPIGAALLDQRVMAGAGNVYRCELCFLRGLNPWTPVSEAGDLVAIVELAHRLLVANRERAMHVTTGDPRPGRRNWVYGRAGQPCLRCGTTVKRASLEGRGGERTVFWCPSCQPG